MQLLKNIDKTFDHVEHFKFTLFFLLSIFHLKQGFPTGVPLIGVMGAVKFGINAFFDVLLH
jgi:hypothetical protein